jgi:hypothetical protein
MQFFFSAEAFSTYRGGLSGVDAQAAVIATSNTIRIARRMIVLPRRCSGAGFCARLAAKSNARDEWAED